MLSRSLLLRSLSQPVKDLSSRMAEIQGKLSKDLPNNKAYLPALNMQEPKPLSVQQKLQHLDQKIAKIQALRQAGRPEQIRIKNLPNKYGRTGRFAAYPWYGQVVPQQDRYPHLADRLGKYINTIQPSNSLQQTFQLSSDLNDPAFQSFFVEPPSRQPDEDLNFEKGEIIYENPAVNQTVSLIRQLTLAFGGLFSFNMGHTNSTGRATWPVGDEFMDERADWNQTTASWIGKYSHLGTNWQNFDDLGAYTFLAPCIPVAFICYFMCFNYPTQNFVTKLQYNADKQLVFISRVIQGITQKRIEEVYETVNLQVLPPAPKSGYEEFNDREWETFTCMNTNSNFTVSTDPQYWHSTLGKEFRQNTYALWTVQVIGCQ